MSLTRRRPTAAKTRKLGESGRSFENLLEFDLDLELAVLDEGNTDIVLRLSRLRLPSSIP
jgi:hypothetical protein